MPHAGLVDALAHLDDSRVVALPALLARAAQAGVTDVVSAGVDPRRDRTPWNELATSVRVWRAVGLHPREVDGAALESQLAALEAAALTQKVVAIGEIGLDGRRDMPDAVLQEEAFCRQVELAKKLALPMILHCVQRIGRITDLLASMGPFPAGAVIHGFGGPAEIVPQLTELGLSMSFGGLVTHAKSERCRRAAEAVPAQCLLVESDTPDHAPETAGKRPSEPADVREIIRELARLRAVDATELGAATAANARRIYKTGAVA